MKQYELIAYVDLDNSNDHANDYITALWKEDEKKCVDFIIETHPLPEEGTPVIVDETELQMDIHLAEETRKFGDLVWVGSDYPFNYMKVYKYIGEEL